MVGGSLLLLGSNMFFGGWGDAYWLLLVGWESEHGKSGRDGMESRFMKWSTSEARSHQPFLLCGASLPRLGRVETFLFGVRVGRGWEGAFLLWPGAFRPMQSYRREEKNSGGGGERKRQRDSEQLCVLEVLTSVLYLRNALGSLKH